MRGKISKIVGHYRHSSFDTPEERKEKWNRCTDELTALMCYLEVRRWLLTMDYAGLLHYNLKSIPESEYDDIVEVFHSEYPKGMIIQAIEQVKNEQP